MFGFYSQQARDCGNHVWTYSRPDGSPVLVTAVCRSPEYPEYRWPDAVCVGEVSDQPDPVTWPTDPGFAAMTAKLL